MRRLLFAFLKILGSFRKAMMKLSGISEDDLHSRRVATGKSWEEFCDQLKLAGASLMYPGAPKDPSQQAEGLRYLSRLTRAGLEAFVEYNDPAFPVLRRMVHETVKMGADNPDNHYMNAQISGKYEYRVTGNRNTVPFISFYTQSGNYGTTGGLAPCGKLDGARLKTAADGTFEIILSKDPKGENWLKLDDDTTLFMVRQTFLDREHEKAADIRIENLDGRRSPGALTPAHVDGGLKTASMFVAGASLLFARWAKNFQSHTNRLPLFDPETSNQAGGDEAIFYYHSHWKLREDEALVIEVTPPDCEYWNFQLNNYWMESLDYRYFPVSLNKAMARYAPDGSVRVIVCHQDPGLSNWIDTCGHQEGTMCWRWYRLKPGVMPVEPQTKLVKLTALLNDEQDHKVDRL